MSIPKPKVFWPLTVSASNRVVYVNSGGPLSVNLASGTYLSGAALATELATKLNTLAVGTFVVTLDTNTGRMLVANLTTAFSLNWADVTTNSAAPILGWALANTSSALSQPATKQHANGWYSDVAVRRDSLNFFDKSADRVTIAMSGQSKRISEVKLTKRNFTFGFLAPHKTLVERESTNANEAIERWWDDGAAKFRYWADQTVEGTYADYLLDEETAQEFQPERMYDNKELYQVELRARLYAS